MQVSSPAAEAKMALYRDICEELHDVFMHESDRTANAANTSALLKQRLADVNWVGFYFVEEDELVLGPFQGNPACTRIPFGKGVCGKAAAEARTVIVSDVGKFPGHIACDNASRSEIVVPLLNWGKLRGILDLDSASLNRFDEDDAEGLESIAAVFMASLLSDDLPDLNEEAAFA
jgi:L-methionine (R)-S-oxide reductase